MKKQTVLMIAIAILAVTDVAAQVMQRPIADTRNDMVLGVKAGMNVSNVWDARGEQFRADAKAGFVGGGFLSIPIGKYLGVQPEVLFSQKGFQGQGTMFGQPYSFARTTDYLEVPILAQVKPAPFLTILAGPQYSYLLSQKNEYHFANYNSEQQQEFDHDNIRKNTMGLLIGGDVIVAPFIFSARAGWDLQANHGDGTSSTPRYKNQWLQLTLGFQL